MTAAACERRLTHRFVVQCSGELAIGSSVTDIDIIDISVTGCGVELDAVPGSALTNFGVLSISREPGAQSAALLPVMICNSQVKDGRARLGLRFRSLNILQTRSLITIIDANLRG